MDWLFLIPVGIAIGAFCIFERSEGEIAVLSAVITLTSLILSLVLAPWQVQLGVLAIALIGSRRAIRNRTNMSEFPANEDMISVVYSSIDQKRYFR